MKSITKISLIALSAAAFSVSPAVARQGADDPAGHVRQCRGCDDPVGHVRGADDPAGHVSGVDDRAASRSVDAKASSQRGLDDPAGHVRHGGDDPRPHG
jgi:hypothetical protein